ncbi:MAG: hypothetical protein IKG21_04890 [Atopobiaceae bacterium]|nr:hypothetical protein [Atopobiaceae bacterium]
MKHAFGDGLLRRSLSLTVASAMVLGMCPTAGIAEGVLDAGRANDAVEIVEGYNDFCDGGSVPVGQGEASTGEEPSGDENAVAARGEGEEPAAEPEAELQLRVEPAAEPAAEPEAEAMAGPEAEEAADSYAITIDSADHGTVTASVGGGTVGTANVGDTVTLNDSPDEDYALKSLSVKYLDRQTETFEATSQTVHKQYCEIVADDPDYSHGWVFSPEKGLRFSCVSPYTFESVLSYSQDSVEGSVFFDVASFNTSRFRVTNNLDNIAHIQKATVVCRAFFPVSVSENDGVKSFVMPNGPVTVTAEFAKKHSVTLAGGAHASFSGSTSQTGLVGAMETVTYTADEGYLFPEFEPITSDGVTATRTSETEVTVSGTPTADVSITVPDARLIPATAPTIDGVSGASLVYGYAEGGVSVTATAPEGHTLRYQWFKNAANSNQGGEPLTAGGDSAAHSVETGKNAGTTEYYYCVVTATRNDNGQKASATSDVAVVTVEKADPAFTAPTGRTLTYNGSGQELVGAGSSDDGTLYYATAAWPL